MIETRARLVSREVLPFAFSFALLIASALLVDALLHVLNLVWIGRYLAFPGVLLIVGSFWYSLRKRRLVASGNVGALLRVHETMSWVGAVLLLVHAGVHFDALLGWLAVGAMLINVGSGLTGKFLMARSRRRLDAAQDGMRRRGVPDAQLDEQLNRDMRAFDVVRQWRVIHVPISIAFAVLAVAHIVSILLYWSHL
jgi:hypothetical protein